MRRTCVGGSKCSGLAATEVHVSELRLRLCIALLRRSRVQLRGLLLVLLYAFALAGSECSGLASALAVRPHVARSSEGSNPRPKTTSAVAPASVARGLPPLRRTCVGGSECSGLAAAVVAAPGRRRKGTSAAALASVAVNAVDLHLHWQYVCMS